MNIKYTIVVEGKDDKAFLSNFLKGEIITINGREIDPIELIYIKELNKKEPIIVLVDNDFTGKEIRKILNEELINVINIDIENLNFRKKKKQGVAECFKNDILNLLKPYEGEISLRSNLSFDLFNKSSLEKEEIISKYHLGRANNKNLCYRLKRLGIKNIEEK